MIPTSPPSSRSPAHDWSDTSFKISSNFLVDADSRVCLVRGVNLCGNSKLPTSPQCSTHLNSPSFYSHTTVSFVGRPLPLNTLDEHFSRLKSWGLTFLRLLVPWESLEHSGPGIYDEEFIDYLIKVITVAHNYGIKVFIDPHQDTWSRFSGGSGAPGWTFEKVGLDLTKFKNTGAAHLHRNAVDEGRGHMYWPTNYTKLASATMFTVFFGTDKVAPLLKIDGKNVGEYLQDCFVECYKHLARRLLHLPAVVGFEVMNEPHSGYIEIADLHSFDPVVNLLYGPCPSALQSFALGDGVPQEVGFWTRSWPWPTRRTKTVIMNERNETCWLKEGCIWRKHGVWDVDPSTGKVQLLKPDYFTQNQLTKQPISFNQDCYLPFIYKFRDAILSVNEKWLVFFEPLPNEVPPDMYEFERMNNSQKYANGNAKQKSSQKGNTKRTPQQTPIDKNKNMVYAPHWYDLKALFSKQFDGIITHDVQGLANGTKNVLMATYIGHEGAKRNYIGQVRNIVSKSIARVGQRPCLIGECGIPMDINEKKAYETGDYTIHTNFLDAVISAMESNLVNFTLWNYNPGNDNLWGDHWNGEDFSIYSPKPKRKELKSNATTNSSESVTKETEITSSKTKPKIKTSNLRYSTTAENEFSESTHTPFEITPLHYTLEGCKSHHHHIGGRALDAVIRPYAAKVFGIPLRTNFDLRTLTFNLTVSTKELKRQSRKNLTVLPTEIFIPNFHYEDGIYVKKSDGKVTYEKEKQTLYWEVDMGLDEHYICVSVGEMKMKEWSGSQYGWYGVFGVLILGVALGLAARSLAK
ncbi:hypothetical protein HK098_002791 [Nowakowskiella sp. JEL0407]|nr:hypothetical protein HK098_002791 [Nowakowskiella sp. JEL0407]